MSKIAIHHDHTLDATTARERISGFESYMSKYGAKLIWSGNKADLKGPGVSGNVELGDHWVEIKLKLGMLARAAGVDPNRLEGSIKRRLEAAFHPDGPQPV